MRQGAEANPVLLATIANDRPIIAYRHDQTGAKIPDGGVQVGLAMTLYHVGMFLITVGVPVIPPTTDPKMKREAFFRPPADCKRVSGGTGVASRRVSPRCLGRDFKGGRAACDGARLATDGFENSPADDVDCSACEA
mmetsp:Transcript_79602/g.227290  ORF Transcript_79602/g.227290 Transcript_79602/m.227290 type:complete len:137 (+) Transcript_79602:441-851(+)